MELDDPMIDTSRLWIWAENGRNIVGCLAIRSFNAWRTVSNNGASGFSLRSGSAEGFTETRFKEAVMNAGRDGVVISRTKVW